MGDFNSRTGKYSDNVCQEGNTIITNDQSEFSLCALQRHSFDNELNNHGKRLLEICRSADLTIIKNVKKRYTRLSSVSSNKKWFDKECRLKRHELRKLANLKHRDPLNITLRENYHTVLKQYKNVLKQKRKEYYHTKISEMEDMIDNSNS